MIIASPAAGATIFDGSLVGSVRKASLFTTRGAATLYPCRGVPVQPLGEAFQECARVICRVNRTSTQESISALS